MNIIKTIFNNQSLDNRTVPQDLLLKMQCLLFLPHYFLHIFTPILWMTGAQRDQSFLINFKKKKLNNFSGKEKIQELLRS